MNYLKINHFKCFVDADININALTIMAGANGNGKSTAIQALLYLRRTIEHCGEWLDDGFILNKVNGMDVPLNGVYCLALGNSSFVLNRNALEDEITLGLFNEEEEITVSYHVDNREPKLYLTPKTPQTTASADFPIFKQQFYYLNAERIGPRISQGMQFSDYPNAGWQGETTAQLLSLENGYFKVENDRMFPGTNSNYLYEQVNFWLDFIMKGVKIKVDTSPNTLTAQILIENQFTSSDPTLSTNLGFGISYILPILATALTAKKGCFFIIENPEAHLHPSAQSKMGRFLAMAANAGLYVITETHSDHLINGIQIAVAEEKINNETVTINFFNQQENSLQPEVQPITITTKGELSEWPNGFFDQTQMDYAQLFNLRKKDE